MNKKKLIILGLDGATWNAIDPLIESGDLKFFNKLKKEKAWGKLRSVILPITATAWPAIFTGKNPGKHGVFDFCSINNYKPGHYVCSSDIKSKFLWEYLQESDLKCGLINIPLSSPFRSEISFGEGDHLRKDWFNFSWPEDTTAGLNSRNPMFNQRLLDLLDLRFDQLDYILKNKKFNLLSMNIYVNDPILHFRWNHKEFIKTALKKIDSRLEKFVKKLDKDTCLIIVSDHGMTKLKKNFNINNWLEEKGYLTLKKKAKPSILAKLGLNSKNYEKIFNPMVSILVKLKLMKYISKNVRNKYRFFIGSIIKNEKETDVTNLIDWEKTKAYSAGVQGRIIINLKGRENEGSVSEEEYVETKEKIMKDLKKFFKEKEIKLEVYTREELYHGPYLEKAPDIVFIAEEGAVKSNTGYNIEKKVITEINDEHIQADHHVDGIFIALGNKVKKNKEINTHVLNITPTALAYFGIPIPSDMDGEVIENLMDDLKIKKSDETKNLIKETIDSINL